MACWFKVAFGAHVGGYGTYTITFSVSDTRHRKKERNGKGLLGRKDTMVRRGLERLEEDESRGQQRQTRASGLQSAKTGQ